MNLRRFPILLTSTLIVAATALLAPADAAEERLSVSFNAAHVTVGIAVDQSTCPPPPAVCVQPVCAPPACETVWIEGVYGADAYGRRVWLPAHYEQRPLVLQRPSEHHYPEPRLPDHRSAPPAHFPDHGGAAHHDDGRGPGAHDDHGPAHRR